MRNFRPRLSLRFVLCLLTVACAYCACWSPTKEHAKSVVGSYGAKHLDGSWEPGTGFPYVADAKAVAPLIVAQSEIDISDEGACYDARRSYVWLLGIKIKLPGETRVQDLPAVIY